MNSPSAAVRRVLEALERIGNAPRPSGAGWSAPCPAHEDRVASLSIGAGEDGCALLKCHAGCETSEVLKALGLEMRDLFEARGENLSQKRYEIRDQDGRLVATHGRIDEPGGKRFYWEREGKSGLRGIRAASLPLYGSELVRSSPVGEPVLVVEGEKAADALRRRGFAALGTVCGAGGTPTPEVLEVLRDRRVVLLPDADEAGRGHMRRIAARLEGVAASVRWFEWAGAPEHGDAHDYFAAGGTPAGLRNELGGAVEPPSLAPDAISASRPKGSGEPDLPRSGRKKPPTERQGRQLVLAEPELWPDPVDGATLAGDLVGVLASFVVLPPHAAETAALWILHSHALQAAQVSPLLIATSPTKRCGKTTLLHVLSALVPRPLMTSNVTPAALFRTVEKYRPTLLVDEADTFVRLSEELRGLLNAGHARAGALVIRTVGDDFEPRTFSTWCPKAVALIGRLPDSIEDRAVIIPMRRRNRDERVGRLRIDRLTDLEPLRRRAARWAADYLEDLRAGDIEVPPELNDRQADNWRPLLAIADLLGGEWPARARQAALALAGLVAESENAGELLLADLKKLFAERQTSDLPSDVIRSALIGMDGRPWPEWKDGKPISLRGIARLLKPFGIESRNLRIRGQVLKGYSVSDLEDAFARYLPSSPSATALPPAAATVEVANPEPLRHPAVAGAERSVPSSTDAPRSAVAEPQRGTERAAAPKGQQLSVSEIDLLLEQHGWEPVPNVAFPEDPAPLAPAPMAHEKPRQTVLPLAELNEAHACPETPSGGFHATQETLPGSGTGDTL